MNKEVVRWYYSTISVEKNKLGKSRPAKEKEFLIDLKKISNGLNADWYYVSENLDFKYIDYSSMIIDYVIYFENKNTGEIFYSNNRYYFDDENTAVIPIPLITTNKFLNSPQTGTVKNIWNGDFDDHLRYYEYKQ